MKCCEYAPNDQNKVIEYLIGELISLLNIDVGLRHDNSVTKLLHLQLWIWSHFMAVLKSDLEFQQTGMQTKFFLPRTNAPAYFWKNV